MYIWKREVANNIIRKTYDWEGRRVHYRNQKNQCHRKTICPVLNMKPFLEYRTHTFSSEKVKPNILDQIRHFLVDLSWHNCEAFSDQIK